MFLLSKLKAYATLILGGLVGFLGLALKVVWGQKKAAQKEAKTAKKEVRRRVEVQKADQLTREQLREVEREVEDMERDELIDRLDR